MRERGWVTRAESPERSEDAGPEHMGQSMCFSPGRHGDDDEIAGVTRWCADTLIWFLQAQPLSRQADPASMGCSA